MSRRPDIRPASPLGRFLPLTASALALGLAACSDAEGPASLMTASLATSAGAGVYPVPPTEMYTRVASGALKCWFGRNGALKGTHVFHADAESPVKGGAAEIVVFERDPTNQNPRGLRAFRIAIAPAGSGTHVAAEALRVPEAAGVRMRADVFRWAGGSQSCGAAIMQGWTAAAAAAPAAAAKPAPKKAAAKASSRP